MNYYELVESITNILLDEDKVGYHATPLSNLVSIAKEGLTPNTRNKYNHGWLAAQEHSKGKTFYSTDARVLDNWQKTSPKESLRAGLRIRDISPTEEQEDTLAIPRGKNKFTTQTISPDRLDLFTSRTGWTPLSAHDPELYSNLGKESNKRDLRISFKQKKGEQLELFPLSLYTETIKSIADQLLTEIVKVSLAHPTSTNIRYGALFGDIIKKARAEGAELGLKGADKLSVTPIGGSGATLKGSVSLKGYGKDVTIPPTMYVSLPNERTGGIPAAKQSIAHEVGHWLNKDVEQASDFKGHQQALEKEVKAVATSRAFAGRAGIEINPEQDQRNLNTYRRGVMRPVPISSEEEKRDAARRDIDTDENIAVLQNKFDIGKKETKMDLESRRVVSGKNIYLNPSEHRIGIAHKMLGIK